MIVSTMQKNRTYFYRKITVEDAPEFLAVLNSVISEKYFLASTKQISISNIEKFVERLVKKQYPEQLSFANNQIVG